MAREAKKEAGAPLTEPTFAQFIETWRRLPEDSKPLFRHLMRLMAAQNKHNDPSIEAEIREIEIALETGAKFEVPVLQ